MPPKGSLALILPTAWVPSAHKATDGHAFRRHMRPELFALQGFISLRLHLPEEELDGVLHEAGDGHRTYAARNWGNY